MGNNGGFSLHQQPTSFVVEDKVEVRSLDSYKLKDITMMKTQQILDNEAKARSEAINRLVDEVKSLRSELWVLRITAGVAFTALIVSTFVKGYC